MNCFNEQKPYQIDRLTGDQLVTLQDLQTFKEDLILAISKMLHINRPVTAKKWLKTNELVKLLGISKGTLQTLRNNGTVPFARIGGILYYDIEEINKSLISSKNYRHDNQ
jgi:hypothetical protein